MARDPFSFLRRFSAGAIVAALVAIGVLVVGRSGVSQANDGQPIVAGSSNSATYTTYLDKGGTTGETALSVNSDDAGGEAIGAYGYSDGVPAIQAIGETSGNAVNALTEGAGIGLYAVSQGGDGVEGTSDDGQHSGVAGFSNVGGNGVYGTSNADNGGGNAGVYANNTNGGWALHVNGAMLYSRSGLAKVPAGATSAKVSHLAISSGTLVLATISGHYPGVYLAGVSKSPANGQFTIYLNEAAPTGGVSVAWFLVD